MYKNNINDVELFTRKEWTVEQNLQSRRKRIYKLVTDLAGDFMIPV